jgi:hypothetical protein
MRLSWLAWLNDFRLVDWLGLIELVWRFSASTSAGEPASATRQEAWTRGSHVATVLCATGKTARNRTREASRARPLDSRRVKSLSRLGHTDTVRQQEGRATVTRPPSAHATHLNSPACNVCASQWPAVLATRRRRLRHASSQRFRPAPHRAVGRGSGTRRMLASCRKTYCCKKENHAIEND